MDFLTTDKLCRPGSVLIKNKERRIGGGEVGKHGYGLVSEKGDTSSVLPCFAVIVCISVIRGKPPSPQGEGFSHCKFILYCKELKKAAL